MENSLPISLSESAKYDFLSKFLVGMSTSSLTIYMCAISSTLMNIENYINSVATVGVVRRCLYLFGYVFYKYFSLFIWPFSFFNLNHYLPN
jgi:hypothetical protein